MHVHDEHISDEHEELFVCHVVLEVIVIPEQVVAFHVYQERSKQTHKQQVVMPVRVDMKVVREQRAVQI